MAVAEVGRDEGAAQQRFQKFFHRRLGLDHGQGVDDLALLQSVLNRIESAARRHFAFKSQLFVVWCIRWPSAATLARPALLALRSARICCADSGCSVRTSCRWWPSAFSMATTYCSGTRMRSASEPMTERDWRKAAWVPALKPFVRAFELLEHVQARTFLGLLLQKLVLFGGRLLQFRLQFAQPVLPLLDRTALGLRVEFFGLDARGEFLQTRFQPRPLLFQLHFFRGQFFQPDDVALFLQIERGDFVADARQILRGGERGGLRLAQRFLPVLQILFHLGQRLLSGLQRQAMLRQRGLRTWTIFP